MLEAIVIIIALGGLEFMLWHVERKRQILVEKQDDLQQQKQLELLEGILTELAIANSDSIEPGDA